MDFGSWLSDPGTFVSDVRMADDDMSDCVGGDYVIEKMPKNDEIGDTYFRKGITSEQPFKSPNKSLECLLLPF